MQQTNLRYRQIIPEQIHRTRSKNSETKYITKTLGEKTLGAHRELLWFKGSQSKSTEQHVDLHKEGRSTKHMRHTRK